MRSTKALVSDGNGAFDVKQITVGEPAVNEVRVKIKAAGLCHTDWDSIQNWNKPFIVGHEGAGIVDAVGKGVTKVAPGQGYSKLGHSVWPMPAMFNGLPTYLRNKLASLRQGFMWPCPC